MNASNTDFYDGELYLVDETGDWIRTCVRIGFAVILVAILSVGAYVLCKKGYLPGTQPAEHLVFGPSSSVPESGPLRVRGPSKLDGVNREQILELRKIAAASHTELISADYEPNRHAIADWDKELAWRSTLTKFGHDANEHRSDLGSSNASRWLNNPLLLIGADIWPVDPTLHRLQLPTRWRPGDETSALPLFCDPSELIWDPQQSRGEVTYHVGDFLTRRKKADRNNVVLRTIADLDVNMFNARDFGFQFCYTSEKFAKNVTIHPVEQRIPIAIQDVLAPVAEGAGQVLDINSTWQAGTFQLTGDFPASLEFLLWKREPKPGQSPDLRFLIRFTNSPNISPEAQKWIAYFYGSQDALCVAGVALSEIAQNPADNLPARDRAIEASRRLERLSEAQKHLPTLDGKLEQEVKQFVRGDELQVGYSIYARSANVIKRLKRTPGYEELFAEYVKPHWQALHGLRKAR